MKQENLDYCRRIQRKLEAYYNGEYYRCPICGERVEISDFDKLNKTDGKFELPCGCTVEDKEDLEHLSVYDFFDNTICDVIYYIGNDGDFRGVRIMIACGGPNVYVDTYRQTVELYWWSDYATVNLFSEVSDTITEAFEEVYQACK